MAVFDVLDETGAYVVGEFSVTNGGQVLGLGMCDPRVEICDKYNCHKEQVIFCIMKLGPGCPAADCITDAVGRNCMRKIVIQMCQGGGTCAQSGEPGCCGYDCSNCCLGSFCTDWCSAG